ncbi:MAG: Tex family protein [Saprospiraceae bacterium]|jgi:protein Tex|uniref:Tex family protein n=1 Tax=Candidatus Brachybacter algidus TaxID=2982024 RepID=UPI001B703EF5|nr:Tex family protein [Candidatus Brachybacter algidus]MBP7304765.1 RNA-binding transcriptional accessory protein [Saprospiraceae bacterium]MBK6449893.1 RNA-binding transcriptional accessory protein [Candidatus Brachybacter algidus]MBK7604227.1 RNA-binding transcriptional accessory protein [Candidatus Brachybacter algidus]MBK9023248.1 RNA-binding transcriptional accessory protein [Candidatus Brachybacter algidus]MBL0118771.1 RNA-binding transcriptional accessory protein [Candidatus Brachybacte
MVEQIISNQTGIPLQKIKVVLELFAEGATIPFIARYRKDKTGGLDEIELAEIRNAHKLQIDISERRTYILKVLEEKNVLTDALKAALNKAKDLIALEDIYAPYKTKRKSRATVAKENGLEPLALKLLEQRSFNVKEEATRFKNENIKTADDALQGARDIIAEMISEDAVLKANLRQLFSKESAVSGKVIKTKLEEAAKYKDYFEYSENIKKIPSHRFLALSRGVNEGFIRMSIGPDAESALMRIDRAFIKNNSDAAEQVNIALEDSYKRLIQPGLESEMKTELKAKADKEAIDVFAKNLKQLLLASPLGEKKVLAIDPGFRSGCKVVVLSKQGALLDSDLIYIHESNRLSGSAIIIDRLIKKYHVDAIAIGDGTAGRETEKFIRENTMELPIFLVNEDGASIYSASTIAREEFPDLDLTVRGTVSIGRRLMDPLAELVKLDPKSIGVGQYQHDVNQTRLKEKLDQTVESCVNNVGVNLNTSSKYLLSYVSGIGPVLADNIIKYRQQNGSFKSRKELLKVPRLGAKVYEQAAGFLRIKDGDNPLDASGVHPESYKLVAKIAQDHKLSMEEIIGNDALKTISISSYIDDTHGELSLKDIIRELQKPGVDPRSTAEAFEFAKVYSINDLYVDMIIPGQVTNLTNFGAFVDIGVKQDGMVHVSEITDKFIRDPSEILSINQKIMVKVINLDLPRNRIQLSIKKAR